MSPASVKNTNLGQRLRALTPQSLKLRFGKFVQTNRLKRILGDQNLTEPPKSLISGHVIISGWWQHSFGIARGAQSSRKGFEKGHVKVIEHEIDDVLSKSIFAKEALPISAENAIWFIHCNAPEAIALLTRISVSEWRNTYRIGYWAYELPTAPKDWIEATKLFHEIWVPSEYVAEALKGAHCLVKTIPHYIETSRNSEQTEQSTFENEGIYDPYVKSNEPKSVACLADLKSSMDRKNVLGAIRIYKMAFPTPSQQQRLFVKIQNSEFSPPNMTLIEAECDNRSDIIILDECMTDEDFETWMSGIDVVLSPHRAEGFGLVLAEALLQSRPVLATGYSGNMEFMSDLQPFLIDHELENAEDQSGVYKGSSNQFWASPNEENGAEKLLTILDNLAEAKKIASKGRERILELNSRWEF